jgi:hypothetical protein
MRADRAAGTLDALSTRSATREPMRPALHLRRWEPLTEGDVVVREAA